MKTKFIKLKHPSEDIDLTLEVEPELDGGFIIQAAKVVKKECQFFVKANLRKMFDRYDFDEAEVRLQVEQALTAGDERIL